VANMSKTGLLIYCIRDIPVGEKLGIRVFFCNQYEFDSFKAVGKVAWKAPRRDSDWKGYQYGVKFVEMSREDGRKLLYIIKSHEEPEEISLKEHREVVDPPPKRLGPTHLSNLEPYDEKAFGGNNLWKSYMTKLLNS